MYQPEQCPLWAQLQAGATQCNAVSLRAAGRPCSAPGCIPVSAGMGEDRAWGPQRRGAASLSDCGQVPDAPPHGPRCGWLRGGLHAAIPGHPGRGLCLQEPSACSSWTWGWQGGGSGRVLWSPGQRELRAASICRAPTGPGHRGRSWPGTQMLQTGSGCRS